MLKLSLCGIELELCFGFFAVIAFSFLFGQVQPNGAAAALTAALLHETGHIAAMFLFSEPPERVCFYAGGIKIIPKKSFIESRAASAVVLSAGCAVNLICAVLSHLIGLDEFAIISFALGFFNLLPFSYFDGGRLMELFLPYGADRVRKLFAIIFIVSAVVFIFHTRSVSVSAAAVLAFVLASEFFL